MSTLKFIRENSFGSSGVALQGHLFLFPTCTGQERYHSLAPMYYRGAQAAIIVYDITNRVRLCIVLISASIFC